LAQLSSKEAPKKSTMMNLKMSMDSPDIEVMMGEASGSSQPAT